MHDFIQRHILSYLGSDQTPGAAGNIFWATVYVLLVFVGLSIAVIAMNWLERKILAHMQVRLGPMRVGPHGLLQPIADALKLLLKEDIIPDGADKVVFWIAPFIVVLAAFTVFVVVPFGPTHAITDMNIGILFMLGVSSLSVLGIVTAGWASNSHYPLIGALRSSAQMVSYEVAMGLAVVSAILMTSLNESKTGTLSMIGIVQAQQEQGDLVFLQVLPARCHRVRNLCHRDGRRDESRPLRSSRGRIRAHRRIPYRIQRLPLVSVLPGGIFGNDRRLVDRGDVMARWMAATLSESASRADLGLGFLVRPRHHIPVTWRDVLLQHRANAETSTVQDSDSRPCRIRRRSGSDRFDPVRSGSPRARGDIFWFSAKVAGFMYLYIWYRGTFPRYRFDQLMKVGWKVLLPTGLALLILTAVVGMRAELFAQVKEVFQR